MDSLTCSLNSHYAVTQQLPDVSQIDYSCTLFELLDSFLNLLLKSNGNMTLTVLQLQCQRETMVLLTHLLQKKGFIVAYTNTSETGLELGHLIFHICSSTQSRSWLILDLKSARSQTHIIKYNVAQ